MQGVWVCVICLECALYVFVCGVFSKKYCLCVVCLCIVVCVIDVWCLCVICVLCVCMLVDSFPKVQFDRVEYMALFA